MGINTALRRGRTKLAPTPHKKDEPYLGLERKLHKSPRSRSSSYARAVPRTLSRKWFAVESIGLRFGGNVFSCGLLDSQRCMDYFL